MRFKTKDLLVTVLPAAVDKDIAKICLLHTKICKYPTFPCAHGCTFVPTCLCSLHTCGFCSFLHSGCFPCSFHPSCPGGSICPFGSGCPGGSGCGVSEDPGPYVIQYMEDLVALKADLQDTLKQLDTIQKEGLPSSIGSKAEAETLEQSLTAALEQVRAAKKNLK
jgi:hypothetical protein